MSMRNKIGVLAFLLFCSVLIGQNNHHELISSSGSSFYGENIALDWSIGEVVISTLNTTDLTLTQGFHQPTYLILSTKESYLLGPLNIYPNPTTDFLMVKKEGLISNNSYSIIRNINGQLIRKQLNEEYSSGIQIPVSNLELGIYILEVYSEKNEIIGICKFEKIK